MTKFFIIAIAIVFSSPLFAVEAPGKVIYKMPSGELVKREVTLVVPPKGEGDIVLKYGENEVVASNFSVRKVRGRTVFTIVFKDAPGAPEGTVTVFTGTYMRGSNLAVYYGDIYAGKRPKLAGGSIEELLKNSGKLIEKVRAKHAGGFAFKAEIEP